jgi:hypothetical protein
MLLRRVAAGDDADVSDVLVASTSKPKRVGWWVSVYSSVLISADNESYEVVALFEFICKIW